MSKAVIFLLKHKKRQEVQQLRYGITHFNLSLPTWIIPAVCYALTLLLNWTNGSCREMLPRGQSMLYLQRVQSQKTGPRSSLSLPIIHILHSLCPFAS